MFLILIAIISAASTLASCWLMRAIRRSELRMWPVRQSLARSAAAQAVLELPLPPTVIAVVCQAIRRSRVSGVDDPPYTYLWRLGVTYIEIHHIRDPIQLGDVDFPGLADLRCGGWKEVGR